MNKTIKIYYLIILAIATIVIVSCDTYNSTEPQFDKIIETATKWKVNPLSNQKIHIISFKKFNEIGNILIEEHYYESGDIKSRSLYSYQNNRSEESITLFDENGIQVDEEFCNYTYDGDKIIEKQLLDESGNILKILQFDYNSEGRLVKTVEIDNVTGNTNFTEYNYNFNQNGNMIERIILSENGEVKTRDSLNYIGNLNTIEVINFNSSGFIHTVKTFIYDLNGKVTTEYESDSDGNIVRKYIYEYTYFD